MNVKQKCKSLLNDAVTLSWGEIQLQGHHSLASYMVRPHCLNLEVCATWKLLSSLTLPLLFQFLFNLFPVGVLSALLFSWIYLGMFHAFLSILSDIWILIHLFSPCVLLISLPSLSNEWQDFLFCSALLALQREGMRVGMVGVGREATRGFYSVWQLTFFLSLKLGLFVRELICFFHIKWGMNILMLITNILNIKIFKTFLPNISQEWLGFIILRQHLLWLIL